MHKQIQDLIRSSTDDKVIEVLSEKSEGCLAAFESTYKSLYPGTRVDFFSEDPAQVAAHVGRIISAKDNEIKGLQDANSELEVNCLRLMKVAPDLPEDDRPEFDKRLGAIEIVKIGK